MDQIRPTSYVTKMEQLINDAFCTPCVNTQNTGSTPPGQGRSVREFEEQMASLRKENFNLKLRIYFLEEQLPGRNSSIVDGHENLTKQVVDLKVDNEVIRKELHEKQSLLCEAAKAMQLMEEQQKVIEDKSKEIVEELNQKINYLEIENKDLKRPEDQTKVNEILKRSNAIKDVDIIKKVIRGLEDCIKDHNEKIEELNVKINEMNDITTEKDIKIQEFEEKISTLIFNNAELQEQLDFKKKEIKDAEVKYQEFTRKVEEDKKQIGAEHNDKSQDFQSIIDKLTSQLETETKIKCNHQKIIEDQNDLIDQMQLKIISRDKTTGKLSKAIEQYDRKVSELNAENKNLQSQIHQLQNIIKRLQTPKASKTDFISKKGDIYLGSHAVQSNARSSAGSKIRPKSTGSRANPLFFNESFQETKERFDNKLSPSEYKLKEQLNQSARHNNSRNAYPHPSLYIKETKNYHDSSCNQQHYAITESQEYIRKVAAVPLSFTCDLEPCECSFIKDYTTNNSDEVENLDKGPRLKISCSDTSIVSSSSLVTARREQYKNLESSVQKLNVDELDNSDKLFKFSQIPDEQYEKSLLVDKPKKKVAKNDVQDFVMHSRELQQEIEKIMKQNSLNSLMKIKEVINFPVTLLKSMFRILNLYAFLKQAYENKHPVNSSTKRNQEIISLILLLLFSFR